VTSSVAMFEAAMWVKCIYVIKASLKTKQKGENMEIIEILI